MVTAATTSLSEAELASSIPLLDCPPFLSEQDYEVYLSSIAPPRELICPITQELLQDPVIASDGHTYERKSLMTWLSMGNHRSPVTNSLLESTHPNSLVTNLVVASMANAHRERLGNELMRICRGVYERRRNERMFDERSVRMRIEGLLEAGADPNGRGRRSDGNNSKTPLHMLIESGDLRLASQLLHHDASVLLTNDDGLDCIATAQQMYSEMQQRPETQIFHDSIISEWDEFIGELRRRERVERARMEARDRARSQANHEHRERQQTLAANVHSSLNNPNQQHGLGRLEDGVGYFPSLVALQFQSSIPGPSPSVAEHENAEKERLDNILKWIGVIVLVYFLSC